MKHGKKACAGCAGSGSMEISESTTWPWDMRKHQTNRIDEYDTYWHLIVKAYLKPKDCAGLAITQVPNTSLHFKFFGISILATSIIGTSWCCQGAMVQLDQMAGGSFISCSASHRNNSSKWNDGWISPCFKGKMNAGRMMDEWTIADGLDEPGWWFGMLRDTWSWVTKKVTKKKGVNTGT